jgi:hypothetical protein
VMAKSDQLGANLLFTQVAETVRLFRSPRADSIRARERALSNRPDIWLQSKSKQNHQHIALQTGVGPYM